MLFYVIVIMTSYYASIEPGVLAVPVQTAVPTVNVPGYGTYGVYNYNNNLYGYNMLSQIYQNLLGTLATYPNMYNLSISTETAEQLRHKMDKLRLLEMELAKVLQSTELKRNLQASSGGIIDPARIPDTNLS